LTGPIIQGPWGLKVRSTDPELAKRLDLAENSQGAVVIEVESSSPLSKELAVGDVITSINGRRFATVRGIMEALGLAIDEVPGDKAAEANRSLEIEVIRSKPGEAAQTFVLKVDS
jgi:S1-C subfamily serine protease